MEPALDPNPLEQMRRAVAEARWDDARRLTQTLDPADARHLFGELSGDEAAGLLAAEPPPRAAEILLWLSPGQAAAALSAAAPKTAAAIAAHLPSDELTDMLGRMEDDQREAVGRLLPEPRRAESERLLRYPPDSAGGLMETELLSFPVSTRVSEVIREIRGNQERYARLGVQYIYLVDDRGRLRGVTPMRDLLLAPEGAVMASIVRAPLVTIRDTASADEVVDTFAEHPFLGMPVVDEHERLLGVINRGDVQEAIQQRAEEQFRRSQGIVGGEELRVMPMAGRLRRRAVWLGVNLLLCLGGAAVIALNQETLAGAIIVAALLPIVSATSGNAAMQAAAVTIRELTLGAIDPASWLRVLVNELRLASLIGVLLGVAVGGLGLAWGAPPMIGIAAGLAMAINAVLAVASGALVPLALRRLGIDPALASGPITTTMADITGFVLVFVFVGVLT